MRMSSRPEERGAVAVIVAIMALLLFAAAAYAIDLGNLWQTRRNMVTASDAAALGAAEKFALGTTAAPMTSADAPHRESPGRRTRRLRPVDNRHEGRIRHRQGPHHCGVRLRGPLRNAESCRLLDHNRALGHRVRRDWPSPDCAVHHRDAGTRAMAEPPERPDRSDDDADHDQPQQSQPDPCKDSGGNVAGNWGLAFGTGNNANSDTVTWLNDGYPTEVNVGDDIHANTGAFSGSVEKRCRRCVTTARGSRCPYSTASTAPRTATTRSYHTVSFVFVQLVAFQVSGTQSQRFITINLDRGVIAGQLLLDRPRYRNACGAHLRRRHAQPRHH